MKTKTNHIDVREACTRKLSSKDLRSILAFSMIEVLVCTAIIGIAFGSLYAGIAGGFGVINNSRENLRANQVLLEKLETLRLYSWDQINSNGFITPTFTAPFFPAVITNLVGTNADGTLKFQTYTNKSPGNLVYYGTVSLTNAPVSSAYSTNMRMVTVTLNWTNKGISHVREMQTYVTANGLQDYIFF